MTIAFHILHPRGTDFLGFIPQFLSPADPRPAAEQLDANYQHGGGWRPMTGWTFDPLTNRLSYPGDPPLTPAAVGYLRDEVILVYPHAWVLILQKDGSFEVSRMD
jgi:hypothetical protein